MELFTAEQHKQLIANGETNLDRRNHGHNELDLKPVVKLFTPDGAATWLLTEILPDEPDIAFGLCDLGMDCAELGYVSLSELKGLRGHIGLPVERDLYFTAEKTLSEYAEEANRSGRIIA